MLECVVNISEGRDHDALAAIGGAAGPELLDVHLDPDHHRAVLTLVGEEAPRAVAVEAVARLDLGRHRGAHPRIGVVDVVPFVPLQGSAPADAVAARDRFATWIADELGVPAFRYGPLGPLTGPGWTGRDGERTLPEVRRHAFEDLAPDAGGPGPHPTAGAVAVGARPVLVAYNLWLAEPDLALARAIAADLRSPAVRALGLQVGGAVQVSMNLIDPTRTGPADVMDAVAAVAPVARAELVGLLPAAVLDATPSTRWEELDLARERTIEARVAARRSGR